MWCELVALRFRVLTIHNNPENLQLPPNFQRLQFQLADVDTQDCSPFFAPTFDFVEEARAAGHGVPQHTQMHCLAHNVFRSFSH